MWNIEASDKDSFDITLGFMEAIKIAGQFLDEFPEIKNVYCNENSCETDRQGLMLVIELYLAYRRMTEKQGQGSRSVHAIELFDEAQSLNRDSYDEMNDLTHLMYGLLRYKYDRDRITPFILEMAKEPDKK